VNIAGPDLQRRADCEAVLRSLPMWFGIEDALTMYAQDSSTLPTFGLKDGQRLVGFLNLREHFPAAWEIHCIAITADARGQGHGSRLLAHAEAWLRSRGVVFLQVKTVAATSPSAEYAQTRAFYERRGFVPLEIFPELWHPRNPALQCIKVLRRGVGPT
jgi:ribosomal protein S18 acetylase RimI-like enzyme